MDAKQQMELVYLATKRLTIRTNIKVQALEAMMAKSNPELFADYVKFCVQLEKDSAAMKQANEEIKQWGLDTLGYEIPLD